MADDTPAPGGAAPGGPAQGGSGIASELGGLPMEYLIAAPLAASIKAQRLLGNEMVGFINMLAYGDQTGTKGAADKDVLTLPMKLERPVIDDDGKVSVSTITVAPPVLGLVPVPALLIESVDIHFSMEIHEVTASKDATQAEIAAKASASGGAFGYSASLEVTGKMAAQRENTRSTDKTAKYDVTVRAAQQPPTEGMAKLMDLLASTVEPLTITRKK